MERKVLIETILPSARPITLLESGASHLVLAGLFLQGGIKNHNGRIYPGHEIERAVTSLNEKIKSTGPIIGELEHPEGLQINSKNASHVITEMWMEGSNGMGKARVINAGFGLIVKGIVEAGGQLGVSSRGSGNVAMEGQVSDFDIVTIDIVTSPSAPNAYPKALRESLERHASGRKTMNLVEHVRHDRSAQKYFSKSLSEFLVQIRDEITWR